MASMEDSKTLDTKKVTQEHDIEHGSHGILSNDDESSLGKGDILSKEHTDPVLNAKMHLINNVSDAYFHERKARVSEENMNKRGRIENSHWNKRYR